VTASAAAGSLPWRPSGRGRRRAASRRHLLRTTLLGLLALAGCEPVPGASPLTGPGYGPPQARAAAGAAPDSATPDGAAEGAPARATGAASLSLRPVAYASLPGWSDDRIATLLPALLDQCRRLAVLPEDASLGGAPGTVGQGRTPADWQPFCGALQWVRPGDEAHLRRAIEAWLQPYEVSTDGNPRARFGGYFEPEFPGTLFSDVAHTVPVYRRPADLVTERAAGGPGSAPETFTGRMQDGRLVPYWTRAQIDRGALAGEGLALVWLRDPVDLFSLQLQGAGRVRLASGQIVRLGFDGTNGSPYVPLGRVLVHDGQMAASDVNLHTIRAWLEAHPAEVQSIIEQNPNYVFFRVVSNLRPDQGPLGALQLPLTPLRSLAVDRSFLPLGAPVWVDTELPDGAHLQRLMLAQDLGTDIDRPTGADLFFGWGEAAAREAGSMRGAGRMTVLLPRPPRR